MIKSGEIVGVGYTCGCQHLHGVLHRCPPHEKRAKLIVWAIIALVWIAVLALFILASPAKADTPAKPCVPFAQKSVPDETQPEWKFIEDKDYRQGDGHTARFYENRLKTGLQLGVHSFFGQLAFKAWACSYSGEDPKTGDVKDHRISVLKSGGWYTALAQHPDRRELRRMSDNHIVGVLLSLRDKKGKLVVTRTIHAP